MNKELKNELIEILEYFKNGLEDVEASSGERQPMSDNLEITLNKVLNSPTFDEEFIKRDEAALLVHQRFCYELVSVAKKHKKQKLDKVPEFMDMVKAIDILEKTYPELS